MTYDFVLVVIKYKFLRANYTNRSSNGEYTNKIISLKDYLLSRCPRNSGNLLKKERKKFIHAF